MHCFNLISIRDFVSKNGLSGFFLIMNGFWLHRWFVLCNLSPTSIFLSGRDIPSSILCGENDEKILCVTMCVTRSKEMTFDFLSSHRQTPDIVMKITLSIHSQSSNVIKYQMCCVIWLFIDFRMCIREMGFYMESWLQPFSLS